MRTKIVTFLLIFIIFSSLELNASTFTYDKDYISSNNYNVEDKAISKKVPSDGFEVVDETDNLKFGFNENTNNIYIYNKSTDYYWYGAIDEPKGNLNDLWSSNVKSLAIVEYVDTDSKIQTIGTYSLDAVTSITDGVLKLDYNLDDNIMFTMNLKIQNDELVVDIPSSGITQENDYILKSISVLPFMGASFNDEFPGYLAMSNSGGSLMYFKDSDISNEYYESDIYMSDLSVKEFSDATMSLPLFGIVHKENQQAFSSYVTSGITASSFNAYPNGYITNYATGFMKANYSSQYSQNLSGDQTITSFTDMHSFDYSQTFDFLSSENANYTGIALSYQDYLTSSGKLTKVEYDYNTVVELNGNMVNKGLFGPKNVVATDYNEATTISDDLKNNNILFNYVSTNKFGPISSTVDSELSYKLGSNNELEKFVSTVNTNNQDLMFSYDMQYIENPSYFNRSDDVIQFANGNFVTNNFDGYLFNFNNSLEYVENNINKLNDLGVSKVDITYPVQSNTKNNRNLSNDYFETIETLSNEYNNNGIEVITNTKGTTNIQGLNDMAYSASRFSFIDVQVPIESIVFSGYVPMYSSELNSEILDDRLILNLIEYNIYPKFSVIDASQEELSKSYTSSLGNIQYNVIKDTIITFDDKISEVLNQVAGETIVKNEYIDDNVKLVTYSNGVKIVCNYNNDSYTYQNQEINGIDFLVIGGDNG